MFNTDILWYIGGFLLVLTPIVLIHEWGHFTAAKLSKIRVEEFGFGLPPRAIKLAERNGTIYSLNWIPVGGFVRPAGEDDPDVPGGLASASKRARLFVLAAGAGANFLSAILFFWLAVLFTPSVAIAGVNPASPAALAGIQTGDVVLEVDGQAVTSANMLITTVTDHAGETIDLLVQRGEETLTLAVRPRLPGEYDAATEGALGIGLGDGPRQRVNPITALGDSLRMIWEYLTLYARLPSMLINGEITAQEARPVSIVGISQIAGMAAEDSVQTRNPYRLLIMAGFISVALGLTNLLPIPALDGGRILFVLIEAIRGRRIEPQREGMVHLVGMLMLLALMAFLIFQDIANPIIPF
ncbi:MAG: site-2 protease family protein [Candidatus Promineofilum sp.]|jgi:regulator of sigma E protease|nr:site-2 protease family protein [Promineifilum sp.]